MALLDPERVWQSIASEQGCITI